MNAEVTNYIYLAGAAAAALIILQKLLKKSASLCREKQTAKARCAPPRRF